ncbi:MAG: glycoside hydrolase family 2 [Candidatus Marinimicrobia bacterium]|jgi:beta-mannosidase|nr:glycoside hydrolase family 2 [Deltaproteobacteria bacterium]MBT4263699.1 glycoside hydrolase family 2 [Deltaproteobacteria bacterium]MBT4945964.1 glycoside hydrolase family 2 [Candidatus Neomarinimicrobiota bacterium]MBT5268791.1 glycoside hydrolase family 2 [Candidatus Neomarinimicrobiota bacterium]
MKYTYCLNSSETFQWELYFSLQDEDAPGTPSELLNSDLQGIIATVPGNVEVDLETAGKIKNPEIGNNVYDLREYELYRWWYRCRFNKPEVPDGHAVSLCFDGIDCIADIWLNHEIIGRTENMFVEHDFDVTEKLEAVNELFVCIHSPILEGRKYQREFFGVRADALGGESVNIRKAAHSYGWDILPRLVSAGIWKDVQLEVIPPTHFKAVYWATNSVNVEDKTASIYVDWEFATERLNIDDLVLNVKLKRDSQIAFDQNFNIYSTVFRTRINDLQNVDLWWPRGYGEPALYDAVLTILDQDGKVITEDVQKIGIRSVKLDLTESTTREQPGEFAFIINHEKIFVKGSNWVALDALHSRDKEHIKPNVDMLIDLNCNMIRMWGGNVYEHDEFYDLCDANGIMVWHDFMMGCTQYPQDEGFLKKIEVEAAKAIARIRRHPSLVLWAGNNENDVSGEWNNDQSFVDPNDEPISRQLLPSMVRRLDPKTPYLPSSPYISSEAFELAGRVDQSFAPEQHLWGPRGYYKAPFYTENIAKFVSEIGYHGCPDRESLEKMFDHDFVYPWENTRDFVWNDQWQTKAVRSHPYATETIKRNDLMINQIKCVFTEVPTDLDRFIQASQIIQAEAKKYFIEFWRMNKGQRNGILWWNLRDGWPVISDAIVDYYYGKKLAYHYIKRVQTDVCVMIGDTKEKGHPVVIVNDTRNQVKGNFSIKDADTGNLLLNKSFKVEKNGKLLEGYLEKTGETGMWLIQWEVDGVEYKNHYFAFEPHVELDEYLKWMSKLKSQDI